MVHLHPGSDGGLRMCDVPVEERIASWRRAGRGISSKLHAMYPKMRPRVHHILHRCSKATRRLGRHCSVGWGMVQAQVDCRRGGGGLPRGRRRLRWAQWRWQLPLQRQVQTRLQLQLRMDTWIPLRWRREVLRWLLRCLLPLRHRRHLPLRHVVRQRLMWMGTPMFAQLFNASGDRATWCGFELQFYNGQPYFYWDRQWWLARGPSPRTHPYNQATHWWEPYEP